MSSTALTRPAQDMRAFGEYLKGRRAHMAAVAASHLDPERVTRIVLGCVARTPKLGQCTTASIVRSVMQSVELGLEPGSATGQAYLVPFGQDCTLVIGYRGLLDLMRRTGQVASVNAQAVYEGDEFEIAFGIEDTLRHIPKGDPDPAKLIGAYAVVRFRDGSHQLGYMTRKQIDAIRSRSRAGNSGPWVTDYAEMARKTVLRNVAKWCPMSIEMSKAMAVEVATETGDTTLLAEFETIEGDSEPVPEPEPTATERLKRKVSVEPEPVPETDPEPEPETEHAPAPDIPPFNRAKCATMFVEHAQELGVLAGSSKAGEWLKLRDRLLGDKAEGLTWGDMTEDLWRTLIVNLREMAANKP